MAGSTSPIWLPRGSVFDAVPRKFLKGLNVHAKALSMALFQVADYQTGVTRPLSLRKLCDMAELSLHGVRSGRKNLIEARRIEVASESQTGTSFRILPPSEWAEDRRAIIARRAEGSGIRAEGSAIRAEGSAIRAEGSAIRAEEVAPQLCFSESFSESSSNGRGTGLEDEEIEEFLRGKVSLEAIQVALTALDLNRDQIRRPKSWCFRVAQDHDEKQKVREANRALLGEVDFEEPCDHGRIGECLDCRQVRDQVMEMMHSMALGKST